MALQRVETDAIEDDAVTTAKIAANAVAAADIAADAITNVKVAAGAAIAVSKITGLGTAATLTAGTAANNVVQLDGSGRLPAISGANLTGVSTDTSAMENNIAILAFKTQSANNLAKFNLIDQVIDEYKDGTGATYSTAGQGGGSTATAGYLSSIYSSDTVTTPASASDWTGDTGSYTITSGGADSILGDDSIKSNWTSGTGDFTIQLTTTARENQVFGVYPVSEDGTFASNSSGGMQLMTNSWWWQGNSAGNAVLARYAGSTYTFTGSAIIADGSVVQIKRVSGVISIFIDGTSRYTYSQTSTADLRFVVAHHGTTNGNIQSMTFTSSSSSVNAAGTATSTANTALTAPTTGDICMLVEEVDAVTATLNTAGNDLRCAISRNGGTGWDYVTLVDKGSWGTNKKILVANNVAFSNSASGTDMRYKIEWANQVAAVAASGTTHTITASGQTNHSTTQQKIGNSSIAFDGTGDRLEVAANSAFQVTSSQPYTIEFWFKMNSAGAAMSFCGGGTWTSAGTPTSWLIDYQYNTGSNDQYIRWARYGTNASYTWGNSADTAWHHLAVVMPGDGTQKLYLDGTHRATASVGDTWHTTTDPVWIGMSGITTQEMNGYIDEFRISKTARYTSNFIPSTSAFTTDANTELLLHSDTTNTSTTFTDSSQITAVPGRQVRVHATSLAWA